MLLCIVTVFVSLAVSRERDTTCSWSFVVTRFHLEQKKSDFFFSNSVKMGCNQQDPSDALEPTTAGGSELVTPVWTVPLAIAEPALGDAGVRAGAAEEPQSTRHWAWEWGGGQSLLGWSWGMEDTRYSHNTIPESPLMQTGRKSPTMWSSNSDRNKCHWCIDFAHQVNSACVWF